MTANSIWPTTTGGHDQKADCTEGKLAMFRKFLLGLDFCTCSACWHVRRGLRVSREPRLALPERLLEMWLRQTTAIKHPFISTACDGAKGQHFFPDGPSGPNKTDFKCSGRTNEQLTNTPVKGSKTMKHAWPKAEYFRLGRFYRMSFSKSLSQPSQQLGLLCYLLFLGIVGNAN